MYLSSQYCGDRVAILQHKEQNLKRSFGIHPCASLRSSSYELSSPYPLSTKGVHSAGLSLVARIMSLAMLLQVSPRHTRSTRRRWSTMRSWTSVHSVVSWIDNDDDDDDEDDGLGKWSRESLVYSYQR